MGRVFVWSEFYGLADEHAANMAAAPGRLVVAGDSAGGNLALALMLSLRDAGQRLPDAAALFSPATDLTGGSASVLDNAERDAMFNGAGLEHLMIVDRALGFWLSRT